MPGPLPQPCPTLLDMSAHNSPGNSGTADRSNPLEPFPHRQQADRLTQSRIDVGVDLIRQPWGGVFQ